MTTSRDWLNDTSHLEPGWSRPERKRKPLRSKWYRPPDFSLTPDELRKRVNNAVYRYNEWLASREGGE